MPRAPKQCGNPDCDTLVVGKTYCDPCASARTWRGSDRARRLPRGWPATRRRVLDRDHHQCQLRLEGCTHVATEVDHREPGDDHRQSNLRAACSPCNARANVATRGRPARPGGHPPPGP